ncbi:MAG: hypothetical protein P4M13_08780 [Alphaproteobacteria bacterium]|nr:hypothetical protein [Alphaproteobacteria bacterium]
MDFLNKALESLSPLAKTAGPVVAVIQTGAEVCSVIRNCKAPESRTAEIITTIGKAGIECIVGEALIGVIAATEAAPLVTAGLVVASGFICGLAGKRLISASWKWLEEIIAECKSELIAESIAAEASKAAPPKKQSPAAQKKTAQELPNKKQAALIPFPFGRTHPQRNEPPPRQCGQAANL